PQTIDTGDPAPPGSRTVLDLGDVPMTFMHGVRLTLGYQYNQTESIEFSGYMLFQNASSRTALIPGRLDLPFVGTPLGFEGDNGMWRQADIVTIFHNTQLGNAEINYRICPGWAGGLDLLFGVRYVDYQENLRIFTDDDGLTVSPPDPFRQANYNVNTHNHIL